MLTRSDHSIARLAELKTRAPEARQREPGTAATVKTSAAAAAQNRNFGRICQDFALIPIYIFIMLNRVKQIGHTRLHRSWLWRHTSRIERRLVFGSLGLVSLVVYFAASQSIAGKLLEEDIHCLAMNIYHEARGEPRAGQYAVAEVTLNRQRSGEFPDRLCAVVHQKHWHPQRQYPVSAFSWTANEPVTDFSSAAWEQARQIAAEVLNPERTPTLHGALYYHTIDIRPGWAKQRKQLARIGRHIFYQ